MLRRHVRIQLARFSSTYFSPRRTPFPTEALRLIPAFISEVEEEHLLKEVRKYFHNKHYQYDHWDGAISGYRETEKSRWSDKNRAVFERLRREAFGEVTPSLPSVHVLDLAADGFIKPHVDSVKFCGSTIAAISLLSDCVMRLGGEDGNKWDILLERRSLYVMSGKARYDYTHAILKDDESFFEGRHVPRARRVSLICRLPAIAPSNPNVE